MDSNHPASDSTSSPFQDQDERDHTYTPAHEPSNPDTTPSQRRDLQGFPAAARARVDAATRNGGRCLLTNYKPQCSIEYAHILPRATRDSLVKTLLQCWHKSDTLALKAHTIRIRLGPSLGNPQR